MYGIGRSKGPYAFGERIMEHLAKTAAGQQRIAEASCRLIRTTAEMGQQYRKDIEHRPVLRGEVNAVVQAQPKLRAYL